MAHPSDAHEHVGSPVEPEHWTLAALYWEQDTLNFLNEGGASDWSGNHLSTLSLLNLSTSLDILGESAKLEEVRARAARAYARMRPHPQGQVQLMTGTLGETLSQAGLDRALWQLREIPIPRTTSTIDWRLDASFCISPIPELAWKNDWRESDRTQSLRAYPLFELPASSYLWKDNPYRYRGASPPDYSGVDFLLAYWFGRVHNIIESTW